jgi:lipopolysaccharide assembly outer membrane protein LptD (OstA)
MKHTLLVILMFPMLSFAQTTPAGAKDCKPYLTFKFSKMDLNEGDITVHENEGEMKVQNQNLLVTRPMSARTKRKHRNHRNQYGVVAEGVTITGLPDQSLKADHLEYDSQTMSGILKGHITTVENGVEKEIGRYAVVDFSDNRCRIEKLK